jgi:hypothetical protein
MPTVRRPLLISLLILLLAATAAQGQEWARKMFKETSHDFGNVARGAKTQYRFKFENKYEEPLHIVGVRSSCGCTSAEVTKHDLKTWETGEVIATFNTNAFLGNHSATVTVTFDKPFAAEVQLQVTGNIKGEVTLQPGIVELGSVEAGHTAEKRISVTRDVTRDGKGGWQIVDVRSANTNYEVEVIETHRSNVQVAYDLVVRLKPTSPPGYVKDQLYLITNDAKSTQIAVDVEGRVVSNVSVTPSSLLLGTVAPGQTVQKNIMISDLGKRQFKVLEIVCDKCFSFKLPTEARDRHMIPITFTAGNQPGKVSKEIKITTDLGKNVVACVKCQATIETPENTQGPTAAAPNSQLSSQGPEREAKKLETPPSQ